MPEWSKGAVSKTVEGFPSEGSNPSLSEMAGRPFPRLRAEKSGMLFSYRDGQQGGGIWQKLLVDKLLWVNRVLLSEGEVSEGPKEHGWKLCVAQATEGSNPSFSEVVFIPTQSWTGVGEVINLSLVCRPWHGEVQINKN